MLLPWRGVRIGDGPPILTSLTTDEARALARLAAGRSVLEIGSAYGYSAIIMAKAGADSVTAVDPHTELTHSLSMMWGNLYDYEVEHIVSIIQSRSERVLPSLAANHRRFDLVFIDGDHSLAAVSLDYQWARVLAPEGTVACHDYNEDTCPGVMEALGGIEPNEVIDTLHIRKVRDGL